MDPGTLRGRPLLRLGRGVSIGVPRGWEDTGDSDEVPPPSLSRDNINFLPLRHRAPEFLSVTGRPQRNIPIDTCLKAVVVSHQDRRLGFHSIEILVELHDHYARPGNRLSSHNPASPLLGREEPPPGSLNGTPRMLLEHFGPGMTLRAHFPAA